MSRLVRCDGCGVEKSTVVSAMPWIGVQQHPYHHKDFCSFPCLLKGMILPAFTVDIWEHGHHLGTLKGDGHIERDGGYWVRDQGSQGSQGSQGGQGE